PDPTLLLTIPSIHDDTILDCRLFHPKSQAASTRRVIKAAIIAHPYAPLGGCYDDPVVGIVGKELLNEGYIVCTFNFRGATGSKGRTSWTGRPERQDYISVVGFMIHYLSHLKDSESEEQSERIGTQAKPPIHLVFGGYSYGSFICTHLPEIHDIFKTFTTTEEGTCASEIKTRAKSLAGQRNEQVHVLGAERASRGRVVVGGEETSPDKRRKSLERHSIDVRRSLDIPRLLSQHRRKSQENRPVTPPLPLPVVEEEDIPIVNAAYLLISPLLPPISFFTALPFGGGALKSDGNDGHLEKLSKYPTLAVYGNDDFFTSVKKLRQWSGLLCEKVDSKFRNEEVEAAGHFWHNRTAQGELRRVVKDWSRGL
ncbi:hypothetical protein EJ08DRAFT_560655, partial [Tothia fuscella]